MYNMSADLNTHMVRYFNENRFEMFATRDIAKDEELTHVYISATWRKCFADLKPMAEEYLAKQAAEKAAEESKAEQAAENTVEKAAKTAAQKAEQKVTTV